MIRSPRVVPAALAALVALLLAACAGGNSGIPQCEDDYDNDGDGLIDEDDPACAAGATSEAQDPPAACEDGVDNDGDGKTDFPADPGCTSADDGDEYSVEAPDCMNGRDDDGDGKTDFPADPGCRAANQMNEADDCPSGPGCPECGNGADDDFDGKVDFPADPGCTSASAEFEYNLDLAACGTGTTVAELDVMGVGGNVTGTIGNGASNVRPSRCGAPTGAGAEAAYSFLVERPVTLLATTDNSATTLDTVLYVRKACRQDASEVACSDDIGPSNARSSVTAELTPGAYFLIVDAKTAGATGAYTINVTFFNGVGEACNGPAQCAPGYECRMPAGGATRSCERPVCSDNRDDDNDGKVDFPADPGCTSATDATEADDCPNGANCPDCADGVDNDQDGQTDFPADTSCASASGAQEFACTSADPVRVFTGNLSNQTTASLTNDVQLSCGSTNGRDEIYVLRVTRPLSELTIDTAGSVASPAIALRRSSCTGFDLQCDYTAGAAGSRLYLIDVAPGDYYLVVDDRNTSGTYNLNVRGVIAPGGSCDPASTAFPCGDGYTCGGTAGAETCVRARCNDGMDNDGDGRTDFPSDPGCASASDTDEADACPGTGCPACGNGTDDDGDGLIDYPGDPGCTSAAAASEQAPCTSNDPVASITSGTITGTTTGRVNDVALSCGTNGRDEIYRLVVDRPLARLVADTIGSTQDTAVAIRAGTCSTTDLVCDDNGGGTINSRAVLNNVGVGEYFIVVDDENVNPPGAYTLHVRGELPAGATCSPSSSLYVCQDGYVCGGAAGAETCQLAACNDTVDADGDGRPGYPTDPGCAGIGDDDETDACPSGPGCAACSNGTDDDGDGLTDYPSDPGCAAAGATSELAACTSADPVLVFAGNLTGASTQGRANDIQLSCGSNGRDEVYRLLVTSPLARLRIDTVGSALDTVVGVRRNSCAGPDLACDDDGAGSLDSLVQLTNVATGEYFVIVDDRTSSNSTYNLNISGTIPAGGRCNPASTTFTCAAGQACAGMPGMETCAPSACNDGMDNDGDGRADYPADPGCTSTSDGSETDACPSGPGCPVCSNGIDDDGDGATDYPADVGCGAASSATERECASEADPVVPIAMPTTTGSTTGAVHDQTPSCSSSSTAPDRVFILALPVPVATLNVNTTGSSFDTVLSVTDANCGASLGCDDDGSGTQSLLNLTSVPAGSYAIIVDGYSTNSGNFTLNVRGTVAAGTACTSPLFTAGVLACASGTTCQQGTCQ